VFGASGDPLPPTLMTYPTRVAHGYLALLLTGFIILHVLATLYYQFVKKEGLFRRMLYGRLFETSSRRGLLDPVDY
jgi:cytochrome b561